VYGAIEATRSGYHPTVPLEPTGFFAVVVAVSSFEHMLRYTGRIFQIAEAFREMEIFQQSCHQAHDQEDHSISLPVGTG